MRLTSGQNSVVLGLQINAMVTSGPDRPGSTTHHRSHLHAGETVASRSCTGVHDHFLVWSVLSLPAMDMHHIAWSIAMGGGQ